MAFTDNPVQSPSAEPQPREPGSSRGLRARLLDRFLVTGHIVETEQIAARMTRIRIGGPAIRNLECIPGQQIRVATGYPHADGLLARIGDLRAYSVWQFDPQAGVLDLCVMDHGDGPGARWAREAKPGQEVQFRAPEGSFTLRPDAPYYLFAGEETAAVAFGAMLRAAPASAVVHGAIESATVHDHLPLPRAGELSHPLRGTASAAASQILLAAVRELELPSTPGLAYLAGEARTIQLITKHLVHDRHWPRRSILTKPFWTPGKRGME
ncbi:siderophore-interacting protein [Nocardia vinacea]|uniref:siderophore-interacting protein n=1 Tax=Nocardia vinacea TaxID=96468 RepID=UPI003402DE9F